MNFGGLSPITCGMAFTSYARPSPGSSTFFCGNDAVVVSHGLAKEGKVPPVEIGRAVERMKRFQAAPEIHTFVRGKGD